MNKILLAMIVCMFTVSAFACDSHDKSKTKTTTSSETTKTETAE